MLLSLLLKRKLKLLDCLTHPSSNVIPVKLFVNCAKTKLYSKPSNVFTARLGQEQVYLFTMPLPHARVAEATTWR
jgi:hypothetical protein